MTRREQLKLRLKVAERRRGSADYDAFVRSAMGDLDCVTGPLVAEVDRLETLTYGRGVTRVLAEVWAEVQRERQEDAALAAYQRRVAPVCARCGKSDCPWPIRPRE